MFGGGHYCDELCEGKEHNAAGQTAAERDVQRIKWLAGFYRWPMVCQNWFDAAFAPDLCMLCCNAALELHEAYFFSCFTLLQGFSSNWHELKWHFDKKRFIMAGISMSLPSMWVLTNWLWSKFEQKAVSIVHESYMTKYWIPEWEKHSLIFQTICHACPKYVHFYLQRKVLSSWCVNIQSWPEKLALLCWAIYLFSCFSNVQVNASLTVLDSIHMIAY